MSEYYVAGKTAATAATINNVGGALWNPGSSPIDVFEIGWNKAVATADELAVVRITARGTATSTVTPTSVNDTENSRAPASGAVVDVTYSAQPTVGAIYMYRWNLPASIGCGIILTFPTGIRVPGGAGLAIATPIATILQPADVMFRFADPA